MIALNKAYTGDHHGIRGADYECHRQSKKANLRGTFRAFLASRVQNLDSIVRAKDSKLPIVNLKVCHDDKEDVFAENSLIHKNTQHPVVVPHKYPVDHTMN